MKELIDFALLSFASLFVIVDPIALIPTFLVMTYGNSARERVRTAALACAIAFSVLVCFFFVGRWIFQLFSITLPAFQIGGGIVLMIIALDMLRARKTAVKESPEEEKEGIAKDDIAITPLGVPLLAGPGAITTVLLLSTPASAASFAHHAIVFSNIFLVSLVSFLILFIVATRTPTPSVIAVRITTRLMGLLLVAISVQFILNGIKEFVKGLGI